MSQLRGYLELANSKRKYGTMEQKVIGKKVVGCNHFFSDHLPSHPGTVQDRGCFAGRLSLSTKNTKTLQWCRYIC